MEFCNFLNFYPIFLEFSIPSRVGTHRNYFFLFYLFLGFLQPISAKKEATMVFSNFLNVFAIFLVFSITGREGKHRKDFFLVSLFLTLYQPILA